MLAVGFVVGCAKQQLSGYQIPKDPEVLKDLQEICYLIGEYNKKMQTSKGEVDESKLIGFRDSKDWPRVVKLIEEYNEKVKSYENSNGDKDLIGPDSVKEFQEFWQETVKASQNCEAPKWEIDYQKNVDPRRVEDVHKIAQMAEDFYEEKGHYPLADGKFKLPLTVEITTKKYEDSDLLPNPVPMEELEKELKSVLGEDIVLPLDPQKVDAWGGPRLYQYFTTGKHYFVSTNLFFPKLGARYLMPYTYKYEVGSVTNPKQKSFKFSHIKEGEKSARLAYDYEDMALFHLGKKEFDEAERLFEGSLEIYKSLDMRINQAYVYSWFAEISYHKNEFDDVEKMLLKSTEILERYDSPKEKIANNYMSLGSLYKQKNNNDKAEKFFNAALAIYKQRNMQKDCAVIYNHLADINYCRGKLDDTEKMIFKSLEIFEPLDLKEKIACRYYNLALIYDKQDKKEKAREYWTKARDLYTEVNMPEKAKEIQQYIDRLDK
jgi:tetratricopeptide (TPR) repeat protein